MVASDVNQLPRSVNQRILNNETIRYISVGFSTTFEEQLKHEETLEGRITLVQLETSRKLGKTGGLIILVASVLLFIYSATTGWGSRYWWTTGGLIFLGVDGFFVAAMSSWRVTFDPENAAKKAALTGYKASLEMKKKYSESASRAILFWLIALPTQAAFFMLYTYFVVEPTGLSFFKDYTTYAMGFGFLPFLCIVLFGFLGFYYLRGSELRTFMWRVYGAGGRKYRNYKPEKSKSDK